MPIFRRYLIALLLTAIALIPGAVPSSAAPAAGPVQAALQWLHTQQLPDGGFGVRGISNASMTADVVYALGLAGEDPGSAAWTVNGQSALDALAKLAPNYIGTDAGQAGKIARAVATAGRNPRSFAGMDIIAVIEAAYNPATGRYHPDFLFRHAVAVEALQRSHVSVPAAAYAALRNAQLPDGGWFWTFEVPAGTASDVDTTGRVLQVLGQSQAQCDRRLLAAADFLAGAQRSNGAWGVDAPPSDNPPNANSTGLAVAGLRSIGRNPDAAPFIKGGQNGLHALLAFQEASGAFRYIAETGQEEIRLTATADALTGLLQTPGQPAPGSCQSVYLPVLILLR